MKPEYPVQIIWSSEDNAYVAIALGLEGCVSDGKTQEEALANLKIVIKEWLEVAEEEGRQIPEAMTVQQWAEIKQKSNAALKQHIENEVKKAVIQVVSQLYKYQQSSASLGYRTGGVFAFEAMEIADVGPRF